MASVNEWKIRQEMCDIGRRIWTKGFCAGNEGNHSYRLSSTRILCTPTGVSKGDLKPTDMVVVDMEGKQVSGHRKRTSEILLHLAIYKSRPEITAVIHSHPPHATAFAVAGIDLPTCIHPEAEVFLGPVRTAKYVTPGDTRLGDSILPYVKDTNVILLANHGTVTYDVDLEHAYYKLEILDAYARILLLAKQVGGIRPLSQDNMGELLALKSRFGVTDSRANTPPGQLSCGGPFVQQVTGAAEGSSCRANKSPAPDAPPRFDEGEDERLIGLIADQVAIALGHKK
jgi:L-fuculose-phosphate aldolase